jgi:porin
VINGLFPMSKAGCHKWGWVVFVVGLLIQSPTRVEAQDPVIIPGLPGTGLQAGVRPAPTAWPYSDLPGGEAATPTDTEEGPPPTAPPFGLTGDWLGARDALFDEGIDLRTNLSQF